jgi:hypothetical protein
MKTFKATLVRIEHTVVKAVCEASTQEEADQKFHDMMEETDWDGGEVVHAEEFVQDEKEVS